MAVDVLSQVMIYALVYVATMYDYSVPPALNMTALGETAFWGPSSKANATQDTSIRSANITFSKTMISDLRKRLSRNISYNAPLEGAGSLWGFNRNQLTNWTTYWNSSYDFAKREKALNQYPMFKTNIQGLDIFYIRYNSSVAQKKGKKDKKHKTNSTDKETVPLLLLHSFPGSPREFYDALPLLIAASEDRDYVIDVIVPCLPGFGYSDGARVQGFGAAQAAVVMHNLMQRIGYEEYYVHGSDIGAVIASHMCTIYPDYILGHHTTWGQVMSPVAMLLQAVGYLFPTFVLPSKDLYDRMYPLYETFRRVMDSIAYLHWQATKPATFGVTMEDSPAGFVVWVMDIIARDNDYNNIRRDDGGLYSDFTQEQMIDNIMYYWAPRSIMTVANLFVETFNRAHFGMRLEEIPTDVPTWVIQPKHAVTYQSPLILSLKYSNLYNATALDYGGQFFAFQHPKTFASTIFDAITCMRNYCLD